MIGDSCFPPLIFLACHGSRDPRYGQAFLQLVRRCREALDPLPVTQGQLELVDLSLTQQLIQAVQDQPQTRQVILVPLFLGGGVHVDQDLPEAIQGLTSALPHLNVLQTPPLGQNPGLIPLLQARIDAGLNQTPPLEATILLGHGSRAAGFAQILESIIQQLSSPAPILTAYWAQEPQLPQRIRQLHAQGHRRLQVLPCFLFPGGILDQLQKLAAQCQEEYSPLEITLGPTLAPDPRLTQAIRTNVSQISRQLGWVAPVLEHEP